jgi:hypothetical protein
MEMRTLGRLLMLAVPLTILAGTCGALADDSPGKGGGGKPPPDESLVLKKTVDVGGAGLGAFDISFVDPKIQLYVLSDRTNASVDMLDSDSASFSGRIGALCPAGNPAPFFCFQGVVLNSNGTANNNLSGPDGVTIVGHKEIWAGDGDSRIKVIDIASKSFITTISTGGKFRVDEMAYDSRDHILAAANNADTPPFITLFDTNAKKIIGQMVFTTAGVGVDAENGIEQSQWSHETGLFYVSVPQVGSDPTVGGVSVIDPHTMKVLRTLLVHNCSPAGLTLGPRHEALIGCSAAFGTPATTISLIIDITSTNTALDGAVVATVPVGGNDEVWYDKGTGHYYLAARSNLDSSGKADPVLGSVDANNHQLDTSPSTSTTAHSVAADKLSQFVFVPIGLVPSTSPAGTDPTNPCPKAGCIAVFKGSGENPFDISIGNPGMGNGNGRGNGNGNGDQ